LKIGVLGGTFDPVHEGHIFIAKCALQTLELDKVLFLPANISPFKTSKELTASEHRIEMLRLVLKDEPQMEISLLELKRGGVSYTVDTLRELTTQYPKGIEIFLIIGADAYRNISQWKESEQIMELCQIALAGRPDHNLELVPPDKGALITEESVKFASSQIREDIQAGREPEGLAPLVWKYIQKHGLYR